MIPTGLILTAFPPNGGYFYLCYIYLFIMFYLYIEYMSWSSSPYEDVRVFSTLAEAHDAQSEYDPPYMEDDEFYTTHIYQDLPDYHEHLLLDKFTPQEPYSGPRW
jgi:hypothetical protein